MKIYDMILFAIAYILFVSSKVRAERLSMSGVASVWKRNGGSSSACPTAVAVAWAESRGDTKARGQNSNSYDRGLWQINSYWHRDVSDSCAYDKNCNAKNAVRISSNGGKWSPWATYNDGLHRRWMNDAKKACGGSFDVMEENVGGGKVYGEYNKGPIKVGAEHNWDEDANDENVGSLKTRIVKWGAKKLIDKFMDEEESNVGGGKVYGEYNKGPIKVGGEHNWDENAAHRHNQLMHHHRQMQSNKWDEEEANVGGGRVYGEYEKGPYKAGAEYNWDEAARHSQHMHHHRHIYGNKPIFWDENANDENVGFSKYFPPMKDGGRPKILNGAGWDEEEANVGGGRVYGEYNKGPIKVGAEHNWDEQVGLRQPPTRPWEWEGGNGSPPTNPNYSSDALDMQATLQGFKKFDHKWHQFTTHQSIEKFTTPGNFVRRLKTIQKKTNLRKGRNLNFLGAFDALVSSVSGATGAVQGILNLFGKKSSETLVGQFQDRGFSHFNERTTVTVTSGLPTKYYEAFMKDMLKSVVKVPSKHNDAVDQIVRWGLYTGANTWNAAENVFDIGSGGKVKNFQIFLNRNTQCEEMNIVLVKTDVSFKMAEDIFVISKSKSSWGGAFSSTKLHWKKNKAPIKQADLTFVSEYFITLGMNRIKQSHEIGGMAKKEDGKCGGNSPPAQESPFRL